MKNILFIDIDSKIPNLALMKLARYHVNKGDNVFLKKCDNPDKVYVSVVFEKNVSKVEPIKNMYDCPVEIGGYYYNKELNLPDEIEHLKPYYDLYPNCNASYGFTTRGCIRKCAFCIVWRKEGMIKPVADIYEFLDRKYRDIILLDNNILASPKHFFTVTEQIINEDLRVDFNQGCDIRLMTDKFAKRLSELSRKDLRFAFDSVATEPQVRKGSKLLNKYGVGGCMFYILVGFDTTIEEDLHRVKVLTDLKMRCYIMRHKNSYTSKDRLIYKAMGSWVNGGQFQTVMSLKEYMKVNKYKLWGKNKKLHKEISLDNY